MHGVTDIEQLLIMCGGTTPTQFNPRPGFNPVSRQKLPAFLDTFITFSAAEIELVESIPPLFGSCTKAEHETFRCALYRIYREEGYTVEELAPDFPDLQKVS